MNALNSRWVLGLVVLLFCAPGMRADSWTFSLVPANGAISGPPGATIGWGYSITNQSSTNWLMVTGISSDPFLHATPDAFLFTFPILAPMASLTVPYNATTFEGLFQITWDPTAPVGFINTGVFVLNAEFWDNDPLGGGNFLSLGLDQSAAYSASVSGTAPVPEPGTLLLIGSGLVGVLAHRRSQVRDARC